MEFGRQRDISEFYEQLNQLRAQFRNYDSCEKTVVLYYLMVGLPFANARFLQNALDQLMTTINTPETQVKEQNANDPEVIRGFLKENPQSALCLLLNHIPLLKPGNKTAAQCYLTTIERILTEFITPPFKKIYNECLEIMSYVYIHPAFDKEDKTVFKHLLKQVMHRVTPDNFVHSPVNEADFNKKRSNSLTPGTPYFTDTESWSSQENLVQSFQKPRSYSLSCDKKAIEVPIPSSSSESKLNNDLNNLPLMISIMSWLKSLRLHKYGWIFHGLTTSQMLNINEEYLAGAGVTKGARQKIVLSIERLKNRSKLLTDLELGLLKGNEVHDALKELKSILQSPLQLCHVGEDLCGQFLKVMGKVCTQLLMTREPSEDSLVLFNSLCDKADACDCFNSDHRKKLLMWKEQLEARGKTACQKNATRKNNRTLKNIFDLNESTQKSSSYPNMQINNSVPMHRHSVDSVTLQKQISQIKTEPYHGVIKHYSKESQRFKTNCDIEHSLESLCIQMMEHALGP